MVFRNKKLDASVLSFILQYSVLPNMTAKDSEFEQNPMPLKIQCFEIGSTDITQLGAGMFDTIIPMFRMLVT